MPDTAPPARRPRALLAVAAALGLEVLALAVVLVVFLVGLVGGGAADVVGTVALVVLAAALGAGLVACARGLLAGRRWARSPALTWQALQLFVGATYLLHVPGLRLAGAAVVVVALVAGIGLFTPSVVRATSGDAAPPTL